MLKNVLNFKEVINGRDYLFVCDNDSPFADVKTAWFKVMAEISKIEEQILAQQAQLAKEAEINNQQPPVNEPKIEPIS